MSARNDTQATDAVRSVLQQLHSDLRSLLTRQREFMISALKVARAVTMFAAFHFILSGLAVLFGDWASIAGICSAAGYMGARLFHGWLLALYAAWLVFDTVYELVNVLQDDESTVQSKVLLIIFQLLVYGAAFTLVARLLRALHRLSKLALEVEQLQQRHRQYIMQQLEVLSAAVAEPGSSCPALASWDESAPRRQVIAAPHSEGAASTAIEGAQQPSSEPVSGRVSSFQRLSKVEVCAGWPDRPPKAIGDALALCLQVQRQLSSVWGPRAATLRNAPAGSSRIQQSGAGSTSAPGEQRVQPPARPDTPQGDSVVVPVISSSSNAWVSANDHRRPAQAWGDTFAPEAEVGRPNSQVPSGYRL